jgi:hypothetical protein
LTVRAAVDYTEEGARKGWDAAIKMIIRNAKQLKI